MDLSEICEKPVAADVRDAICFKADFASVNNPGSLTYFGGRPCLPPDLSWPELTRRGTSHALTFLGQVNLADIAAAGPATALPPAGVLYFFLDTNIINEAGLIDGSLQSGQPWRVIYSEAGASHHEPTAAPANLMPCFGHPYAGTPSQMAWIEHVNWQQRYYACEAPRIPMRPLALRSFPIRSDSRQDDEQRQRAAWIDAFGQPIVRKGFAGVVDDQRGELFLLAQFPATNIYLEIFAAGLLKNILGPWENQKLQDIGGDHVPAIRQIMAEINPDNLFAPTSPSQQDRLLSIMHDLADRDPSVTFTLNRLLRTAYFWGSSLSLSYSARTAMMAPDELAGITRELFYPLHGDVERPDRISCMLHQMLGHGAEVGGQTGERKENHVMLMQFDSDSGFGWMFGDCGVAQFWITPEDLAAGRFDRVTATLEGA